MSKQKPLNLSQIYNLLNLPNQTSTSKFIDRKQCLSIKNSLNAMIQILSNMDKCLEMKKLQKHPLEISNLYEFYQWCWKNYKQRLFYKNGRKSNKSFWDTLKQEIQISAKKQRYSKSKSKQNDNIQKKGVSKSISKTNHISISTNLRSSNRSKKNTKSPALPSKPTNIGSQHKSITKRYEIIQSPQKHNNAHPKSSKSKQKTHQNLKESISPPTKYNRPKKDKGSPPININNPQESQQRGQEQIIKLEIKYDKFLSSQSSESSLSQRQRIVQQHYEIQQNIELFPKLVDYGYIPRYPMSEEGFSEVPDRIMYAKPTQKIQINKAAPPSQIDIKKYCKKIKDGRKIQDPLQYPYSAIGHLSFQYQNDDQTYYCTAFLISSDLIMTAAHSIFNEIGKFQQPKKILFCPGLDESSGRLFQAKIVFCPKEYRNRNAKTHNFLIMQLKYKIGTNYGHLGIDFENSKIFSICGYPQRIINQNHKIEETYGCMYQMNGKLLTQMDSNKLLKHQITTFPGQSGSPIIQKRGKFHIVIGIHTDCSNDNKINGFLFTNQHHQEINLQIPNELASLKLEAMKLDAKSFMQSITSPNIQIKMITTLNLQNNLLKDEGVKKLTQCQFPNLKKLQLDNNGIKDRGAQYISKGYWLNLEQLSLNYNQIEQKGINALIYMCQWTSLRSLNIVQKKNNKPEFKQKFNLKQQLIKIKYSEFSYERR